MSTLLVAFVFGSLLALASALCPHAGGSLVRWSTSPPTNASLPNGNVTISSVIVLDQSVTLHSIVVASGGA